MKTNLNKECTVKAVVPEQNIVTLDDGSLIGLDCFRELVNYPIVGRKYYLQNPIVGRKYYLQIDLTNTITAITLLP